jgi:sugar lactone lactonase YvrE
MPSKLLFVFALLAFIRTLAQTVITLAGGSSAGSTDGVGTAALFSSPYSVAVASSGAIYVADFANHKIRLMNPNRTVATLAGNTLGSANGVGTAALFNNPLGVAVDTAGAVYVTDAGNHNVRLIHPNRTVITLAGGTAAGVTDGVGTAARFSNPTGIAVDASGAAYVSDRTGPRIRIIYPNRTVITLAGSTLGSTNGVGTAALFHGPCNVAMDASGAVYVAEWGNHKIRIIYPNRTVITLAGGGSSGTTSGSNDGVGTAALFNQPTGVAVDTSGAVYVADGTHKIRLIYPNRTVITRAGGNSTGTAAGFTDGVGTEALFNIPTGVAVDTSGNVYVVDRSNHKIRLIYPFSCAAGNFANFTSRSCSLCPPGSFSATSMAPSCSPCAAGTFSGAAGADTPTACSPCQAGSYSSSGAQSCTTCAGGTFAKHFGSTSCKACPGGHYCPAGTSSWARLNCGRGNYCPEGSVMPTPCPIQVPPSPMTSWAEHTSASGVQGPAFLVESSSCLNHCFWNFSSGDGFLSIC